MPSTSRIVVAPPSVCSTIIRDLAPEGYARGTEILERHLDARPDDIGVIWRAATYFARDEPARAITLFERGAAIEDGDPRWHRQLAQLHAGRARYATPEEARVWWQRALAAREAEAARTSDAATLYLLDLEIAEVAYQLGDTERARALAARVLAAAGAHREQWFHGNVIHDANQLLGLVALAEDNVEAAEAHLAAAGRTPGSPQLGSFGPDFLLAAALLERGSAGAVVAYLEACKQFWRDEEPRLTRWQEAIGRGEVPSFRHYEPAFDGAGSTG